MNATAFPLVPNVRSILALRPNAIGDFMFSLPALHALRHSYPDARIVFVGKPWHAHFLRDRPGPVDDVLVMPPYPGIGAAPGSVPDVPALRFADALRQAAFDLAVQMYGGGRYSNAFVSGLGAALTIGARSHDAPPLDRSIAYGDFANRRLELLQVVALAGAGMAPPQAREVEVTAGDRALAAQALAPASGEQLVILHPGASDLRRRWPAERYAAVADALAGKGALVVISGTADEAPLARAITGHMRHGAADLCGKLSLPALCGLLERARMMISNDTGPLHLALALGTPAVGVFWLTNLMESCPLRQHLLRPALSVRIHCPICGQENRRTRCAHDVCFVDDVRTEEVAGMAIALFDDPGSCGASRH
jgi:ADP-heptose:LPS heptosyltransferase